MEKYYRTNLKRWNELVGIHAKSNEYDLEGFISGRSSLHSIELEALGDMSVARPFSTCSATSVWTPSAGRGWGPGSRG